MHACEVGPFLQPVESAGIPVALEAALEGGAPIAPLPHADQEQQTFLSVLALSRPVPEPDTAAVVATSGSTGRPKGVVLSRAAIRAAAEATHGRLGGPGDWVLAMPAHYVAGLMVIARALVAGTSVHPVSTDLSDLEVVAPRMTGRRYLSLVPTQLVRACQDQRLADALASFHAVLLGGAAADPTLLRQARGLGINVVTTYGMSETCGGCVYDGRPLDGVGVRLDPATTRISIGGPVLFSGYRLQPGLTAAALSGGELRTQDRGRWEQGRLSVTGRVDDVVVSGGVNVDLAEVERTARGWPGLGGAEIAVVGVPDAEWGTRVVAVTDGSGSQGGLRAYLRQVLSPAAAPRQLAQVDRLPRTSSGKIDRQRLVADLHTDFADRETDRADREMDRAHLQTDRAELQADDVRSGS